MKELKALKELAVCAINGTTPAPTAEFSCTVEEVEDTLRAELSAMASDYNTYRRNKFDIFEIMQEANDEYLPNKVLAQMGAFAEVNTFDHGKKLNSKLRKVKCVVKHSLLLPLLLVCMKASVLIAISFK